MTSKNHYIRTCVFCGNSFYGKRTDRYCTNLCNINAALDRALWPAYRQQLIDAGWTVSEIPISIKRRRGYTALSPKNPQGIAHRYHLAIHCPIQSLSRAESAKALEALALHRQQETAHVFPTPGDGPLDGDSPPDFQLLRAQKKELENAVPYDFSSGPVSLPSTQFDNALPDTLPDDLITNWVLCDVCGEYVDQSHCQQHDGVKICLKCKLKANETAYPF